MQSSDLTDMGNQCRTDNMFVGENHLCIQQHTMLNTSLVAFSEEILKQTGYSLSRDDNQRKTFECELPVFGSCSVTVHDSGISGKDLIGLVIVMTKKKISEDEMMPMLEYMKQTIDSEPYYDDHGYGGSPRPHEIDLRWDLPQGRLDMHGMDSAILVKRIVSPSLSETALSCKPLRTRIVMATPITRI